MNSIRVSQMSDKEYSIYKINRRRARKFKLLLVKVIPAFILVLTISIIFMSASSFAKTENNTEAIKYYTSVNLQYSESVYDIACKYYDSKYYSSIDDLYKEIKQINHIGADSPISGGKLLYIPYFVEVQVND